MENQPAKSKKLTTTILLSGLLVGTLDAIAASVQYCLKTNKNPLRVWRYVASGFFGKGAYAENNTMMIIWGFVFHFIIAYSFTALFFIIYPRLKLLQFNIFITAIVYGIFMWSVTNLLVIPLSNVAKFPFVFTNALIAAGILMIAIGLPLALIAKRYYSK
jgi:hypothetical protein